MKGNSNFLVIIAFFATFLVHFVLWKYVFQLDNLLIVKFYLFLSILFMMLITIVHIINRIAPEFLGLSLIGLILLKFVMMYLIREKLDFQTVPNYKFHFVIPYFILTTLLTIYTIQLIKYDKKH